MFVLIGYITKHHYVRPSKVQWSVTCPLKLVCLSSTARVLLCIR